MRGETAGVRRRTARACPPGAAALALAFAFALPAAAGAAARAVSSPGATAAACASAPIAGDSTVLLGLAAGQRVALVHVPPGIPAGRRVPLVLALHGYRGSGLQMERYSGFSSVADRHGFVVVYPSSSGLYWNSTGSPALPDDVAFLSQLITYLEQHMCVDSRRVFATGVSNGGGMVALLGCELSSQIAAIAPVAGGYSGQPPCLPARPVSVLEIHGTADQVVPYFGPRRRPTADGVPPFVNGWARRDQCSPVAGSVQIAPRTTLFRWRGCASGVSVRHIRIRGGRHQWPGAVPPDPGPLPTICASCTIWSFFASLPTRARSWPAAAGPPTGGAGS
jgi:polyhydroxybutyrate depolymerase